MKWDHVQLHRFCRTGSGGTPSTEKKDVYYGGTIPWVKSGELNDDILYSTEECITKQGLAESSAKWAPKGAVLIAMYGATVGKTALLGIDATTNQAICHVVPSPTLADNRYVWYAIRASVPHLLSKRVGGAQPNISQKIIRSMSIPLPPPSEQRWIVEILDQADALRKQRAEADAKAARILPTLFYDMFGDPLTNPQGFPTEKVGNLFTLLRNGTTAEQNQKGRGYPVTRIETISAGIINPDRVRYVELDDVELAKWRMEPGDILFSHINSESHIGKTAIYKGHPDPLIHGMNLLLMRADTGRVMPEYLFAVLNTESVRAAYRQRCKRAVNQASLNQKDISVLEVAVPPIDAQKRFCCLAENLLRQVESQQNATDNIELLFDNLLHRAFTGDLTAKWREAHLKELVAEMDAQAKALGAEKSTA